MTLNKQWRLIFDNTADHQFVKLDKPVQKRILTFFEKILKTPNPKNAAVQMSGNMRSLWRYRVGNYRIICHFEDDEFIILALKIGHRREIYD